MTIQSTDNNVQSVEQLFLIKSLLSGNVATTLFGFNTVGMLSVQNDALTDVT